MRGEQQDGLQGIDKIERWVEKKEVIKKLTCQLTITGIRARNHRLTADAAEVIAIGQGRTDNAGGKYPAARFANASHCRDCSFSS